MEVHRKTAVTNQRNHSEAHRESQKVSKDNNMGIFTENCLNKWKIKKLSGLAYDPAIIDYKNYIGTMSQKCKFCNAHKWKAKHLACAVLQTKHNSISYNCHQNCYAFY